MGQSRNFANGNKALKLPLHICAAPDPLFLVNFFISKMVQQHQTQNCLLLLKELNEIMGSRWRHR